MRRFRIFDGGEFLEREDGDLCFFHDAEDAIIKLEAQRDELASEIKRLIYRDKMMSASLAKLKAERDALRANLNFVINGKVK